MLNKAYDAIHNWLKAYEQLWLKNLKQKGLIFLFVFKDIL